VYAQQVGPLTDAGRFRRLAYVGIDGALGALTLGRRYHFEYQALTDAAAPFNRSGAGVGAPPGYAVTHYDNMIEYSTHRRHGLIAGLFYSVGESPDNSATNRAYAATLAYGDDSGKFNLRVAHQRRSGLSEAGGAMPAADASARNTLLAANLRLGAIAVYAAYGHNKGVAGVPWEPSNPYGALALATPLTDSRDVLLGVSIPFGASTLMASYIRRDDRATANGDASQVAIGISHALSGRTGFYASYVRIENRDGAPYPVGNAAAGGRGGAVNFGLRHAF
jgi:predicted porin